MNLNTIKWDLAFIILVVALLIYLSETDQLEILIELPFVTIGVAYFIGRLVGSVGSTHSKKGEG